MGKNLLIILTDFGKGGNSEISIDNVVGKKWRHHMGRIIIDDIIDEGRIENISKKSYATIDVYTVDNY